MNHNGFALQARRIVERHMRRGDLTLLAKDIERALRRARQSKDYDLETQRRSNRAMRERRKAMGLCPRSQDHERPRPGLVYCDACIKRLNQYSKRQRAAK